MKIMRNITLLLLLLPALALAGDLKGKYTKEKKINKSFSVNATAALDVDNKYGAVYVTTWDQNQTVIDVVIKVSGDKQDQIDKRLNSIDVNFEASAARVAAQTKIGNFTGKVSMEINYTIKIPRKGTTDITNQYGNIILGKMDGRAVVKVQYGSLTIDRLNAAKNELTLQYSEGVSIDYLAATKIGAQYSHINVGQADELTLNSEYTDVKIGTVKKFNFSASYGNLKIDTADDVSGGVRYTDVRFGTITGSLNYSTSYGDLNINRISKDVKSIFVSSGYADINLKYDAAWEFDLSAKATYGNVNGTQNLTMQEKKESGSTNSYKGYYRSAGSAKLTVESHYGDITLTRL